MEPSADKEKILVIDDEVEFCNAFKDFLEEEGYVVQTQSNPVDALNILRRFQPDCIVLDLNMPHMNGVEALKQIKNKQPDIQVVISSAHDNVKLVEECIRLGASGYVTKPVDLDNFLRIIKFALNQRHRIREKHPAEVSKIQEKSAYIQHELFHKIEAALNFLELTEPELMAHSRHVAWVCKNLGDKLMPDRVDICEFSGWFHDLGKLRFPKDLRNKPSEELTSKEQKVLMNYPIHGQDMVEEFFGFMEAAAIIRHQNEHLDGTGFPDGWAGESIPLESRILAVANAFVEEFEKSGHLDFKRSMETGKSLVGLFYQPEEGKFDPIIINTLLSFLDQHKYSSLREKEVTLEQLHSGMILSQSLYTQGGIFLFPEEMKMTPRRIQIIRDFSLIDPIALPIKVFSPMTFNVG